MKKILLSLIALLGISTYATADEVTVKTTQVRAGNSGVMQLVLTTEKDDYRDFQFTLELPDGITVQEIVDEEDPTIATHGTPGDACSSKHTLASNIVQDNPQVVRYVVNTITGNKLKAGGGVLANVTLLASTDLAIGQVLQGKISGIEITDDNSGRYNFADFTFDIEIVEDRIVFNEADTYLPSFPNGDKANVRMSRTIKADEWSTIVLPFTLTAAKAKAAFGDDVQLAQFDKFEVGYTDEEDVTPDYINISFKTYTLGARASMVGGKPYIIKTSTDIAEFSADEVTLVAEPTNDEKSTDYGTSGTFVGTLVKSVVPENGLFISQNKFWYSTGSTDIKAFRGWFMLDEVLDKETDFGVKLNLLVDGEATSVNGISPAAAANGAVYTLDGKQMGKSLNRLPKGIYIQNGKKVVK